MTQMETKPMARIGDTHVCPLHGTNTIVTGSTGFFIRERPVARVGDRTECGAVIVTGAPDAYDGDRLIAYEGSTTSHGGTITTGAPDAFVMVPKVSYPKIDDPPLEPVPILPIEATAQALAEIIETMRKEGLTLEVAAGVVLGAITRKGGKGLPVYKGKSKGRRHTPKQAEIVKKAKEAERTGLSEQEAREMVKEAREAGLEARGPEIHPDRRHVKYPHIHIDRIDHIPIK